MRVSVSAPATTANIGPGFDCLGAALDLSLDVEAEWPADDTVVEIHGEGVGELPQDETNLIVRAAASIGSLPPMHLVVRNSIPLARGLGSSAAAIAAGLHLGCAVQRHVAGPRELLELGLPLEGHADNLAACLYGGLVVVLPGPRVLELQPASTVRPALLVPSARLATETARRALPATVPHADAVVSVSRAAGLVAILSGAVDADPGALLECTADVLHQPYRAPLMPQTADALARLRAEGLAAVVSGAGPSILCLLAPGQDAIVLDGWKLVEASWDPRGARVTASG